MSESFKTLSRPDCGRVYFVSGEKCTRPLGHREDGESVYGDPMGCHRGNWSIWTNRWSEPTDRGSDGE